MTARHLFAAESTLPVPAREAFAWHERDGAFERLKPPWQRLTVESRRGGIEEGARVELRLQQGPLSLRWISVHGPMVRGRLFQDRQEKGPFRFWHHRHHFKPRTPTESLLEDAIEFSLPLEPLSRPFVGMVRRELERTFRYRHRTVINDLARPDPSSRPLRIAVSGASGFLGSALSALLRTSGHEVLPMVRATSSSRASSDAAGAIAWDPESGLPEPSQAEGLDAVVHLAGESIAQRFTEEARRRIHRSRGPATRRLVASLAALDRPPPVFLCGSAVGIYGHDRADQVLDEEAAAGEDFLAEVCVAWEEAAREAESFARVVRLRTGLVLSPSGGLLAKVLPIFRLGLGGRLGSGRQFMSWIALDDWLYAVRHLLAAELSGPVNLVAPEPVTNSEFTRTLASVLRRPALLPVPRAPARMVLGEMAEQTMFASQRCSSERLEASGHEFAFPTLRAALAHGLGECSD